MKRRWIWIGAAALALVAAGFAVNALRGPAVEALEVQPAPLVRTLRFSARVATLSRVDVGSTVTGRVAQVLVDEGAQVRRGDVLVRLESDELKAALAQAIASERQAQARLAGLRSTGRMRRRPIWRRPRRPCVRRNWSSSGSRNWWTRASSAPRASTMPGAPSRSRRRSWTSARAQTQAIAESGTDVVQAQAQLETARAATSVARAQLAQTAGRRAGRCAVLTRAGRARADRAAGQGPVQPGPGRADATGGAGRRALPRPVAGGPERRGGCRCVSRPALCRAHAVHRAGGRRAARRRGGEAGAGPASRRPSCART